jgi:outer membrane protein OmpA-like peptidoglycan-associated protein
MKQLFLRLLLCSLSFISTSDFIGQNSNIFSVYFEVNQHDVIDTNSLLSLLDTAADGVLIKIEVVGYADPSGTDEYNIQLSEKRSKNVHDALKKLLPDKNIQWSYQGNGVLRLPYSNWSQARRADVVVYSKVEQKKPIISSNDSVDSYLDSSYLVDSSANEPIVLNGLTFIPGRHFPSPESMPTLEKLLNTMKKYPNLVIEIEGHICCFYEGPDGMANDTGEYSLSRNRAKFIYDYLLENGVSHSRLSYKGLGSSDPKIFPELTEADRQMNRRVEINILSY